MREDTMTASEQLLDSMSNSESQVREYACPLVSFLSSGGDKLSHENKSQLKDIPLWNKCDHVRYIPNCSRFNRKSKCWEEFDESFEEANDA